MAMEAINSKTVPYQGNVSQVDTAQDGSSDGNVTMGGLAAATTKSNVVYTQDNISNTSDDEPEIKIQSKDTLKKAVNEINKRTNTEAIFGIHDKTNRVMIKIIDKDSKKVLKEYPPEETLDMIAKVWEMAGILVDEKG